MFRSLRDASQKFGERKYLAQSVGYPEMKIYFLLVIYVLLVLCPLGCFIDVAQPAASTPVSAVGSASPTLPPA